MRESSKATKRSSSRGTNASAKTTSGNEETQVSSKKLEVKPNRACK